LTSAAWLGNILLVDNKSCFIIMPFGSKGSEEHKHFEGIFSNIYARAAVECGYSDALRGDSNPESGDILRQVIEHLSQDALVIADLTGANPNVYYELGVRHSLFSQGTILCHDEVRSAELNRSHRHRTMPFNIRSYRVLNYRSDGTGLFDFYEELKRAILTRQGAGGVDSPVHSAIPHLPPVVASTPDKMQQELRDQLRQLREENRIYAEIHGDVEKLKQRGRDSDPFELVERALEIARDGSTPRAVLAEAQAAVEKGDVASFLEVIMRLREMELMPPSARDFLRLRLFANSLDLDQVGLSILRIGRQRHPDDAELENYEQSEALKAGSREEREEAKSDLLEELAAIGESRRTRLFSSNRLRQRFVSLMDGYYQSGSNGGVDVTEQLLDIDPKESLILQNHARAIMERDGFEVGVFWHRASLVLSRELSDSAATWLGNSLHNENYRAHALEAFALASRLDPDDATSLGNIADETAFYLMESAVRDEVVRDIPAEIANVETVKRAMMMALSIGSATGHTRGVMTFVERAAAGIESSIEEIVNEYQALDVRLDRQARLDFSRKIYEAMRSDLTTSLSPISGLTDLQAADIEMPQAVRDLLQVESAVV